MQGLVDHVRLPDGSLLVIQPDDIPYFMQAFISPSSKPILGDVDTNKHFELIGDTALALSATLWLHAKFHDRQ